ncbi:hypothetical protein [Streptomyces sp. NPDC018693]|uniref:hypothetical protein n=1 Tax=unclassified Streptomyces TaxID=2593676 RepID=UPI00379EF1FF
MSTTRRRPNSLPWLRVLVLLLALLAPGGHTYAVPAEPAGIAIEYDAGDQALRPTAHRPAAPLLPAPPPAPAPSPPWAPTHPTDDNPPQTPHILRTVVLRC